MGVLLHFDTRAMSVYKRMYESFRENEILLCYLWVPHIDGVYIKLGDGTTHVTSYDLCISIVCVFCRWWWVGHGLLLELSSIVLAQSCFLGFSICLTPPPPPLHLSSKLSTFPFFHHNIGIVYIIFLFLTIFNHFC